MEIIAKVHKIGDTQIISGSFSKREIILQLDDNPQYPQFAQFQLTQEKCTLADALKIGDEVKVFFNIKGRAWTASDGTEKYITNLDIWKILKMETSRVQPPITSTAVGSSPAAPSALLPDSDQDDLPF